MIKLNLDKQILQKLQQLAGAINYEFLGFSLDLEKGTLTDNLNQATKNVSEFGIQIFTVLLSHYSLANPTPSPGKLVKFKDIPGGYAYEEAFNQRAIKPIADAFGKKPAQLLKAAKLLGGTPLSFGDISVEIPALKGIPLTYIIYSSDEFDASANILYDLKASNYLPTEDLAVLAEITTNRLIEAQKRLK